MPCGRRRENRAQRQRPFGGGAGVAEIVERQSKAREGPIGARHRLPQRPAAGEVAEIANVGMGEQPFGSGPFEVGEARDVAQRRLAQSSK